MADLMTNILVLGIGLIALGGPVALRAAALRTREQRESQLCARALGALSAPDLRGLFTLRAEHRALGADAVYVDLWGLSPLHAWEVMARVSDRLPEGVRLEVSGVAERRTVSTWVSKDSGPAAPIPCGAPCC